MRIRDSVQLQAGVGMYDQEIDLSRSRQVTCSFRHGSDCGQGAQSSSPAPKAQTQIVGGECLSGRKCEKACQSVKIRLVIIPHLPGCQISESGCKSGDTSLFRHTEADGQHSKKSKKSGGKDHLPF